MSKDRVGKKGVEAWISWVLLMGLGVALGTVYFAWMRGYTQETVIVGIGGKSEFLTTCEGVAIMVKNVCQYTQTLNMNVTNTKDLKIDELMFRIYDIHLNADVRETNITIRPGKTQSVNMVKQGIVQDIEIIPVVHKGSKRLVCEERRVTEQNVKFC